MRPGSDSKGVGVWVLIGLAAALGVPGVSSCAGGGKLTREKAEALIRAKYALKKNSPKYENTTTLVLSWEGLCNGGYNPDRPIDCGIDKLDEASRALINEGLVSFTFDGVTSRMSLTPNGQKYAAGPPKETMMNNANADGERKYRTQDVWISAAEFGGITGIQVVPQFNAAQVEWTVITKATPFGGRPLGAAVRYGGNNYVSVGTNKKTETFTKYDDGWRITSQ